MKENKVARDIVANLARRYRRLNRANVSNGLPESIQVVRDVEVLAAWNAYVASQRILYDNYEE